MKIKYFENILKYLPVLLVCIFIGLLGREHFIKKGADEFTVNMIFWIYVGLGILIFAILNLFLDPIVSWLLKRFSNYVESELVEKQESDSKNLHIITSTENFKLNEEPTFVNWSRALRGNFDKGREITADVSSIVLSQYRPFTKKWVFYDKQVIEMPGRFDSYKLKVNPKFLVTTGLGTKRDYSILLIQNLQNFHVMDTAGI